MKRKNNERGAIILESTYCVIISIFVAVFFVSFSFYLYQRAMVSVVANEIAEELGPTYKYEGQDITKSSIENIKKYRYTLSSGKYLTANKAVLDSKAGPRLKQTSLAKNKNKVKVTLERVKDDIGRAHYVVKVEQKYEFLLSGFLKYIVNKKYHTITATAYVAETDVLYYVNSVKFYQYLLGKAEGIAGETGENITSICSTINDLIATVSDWMSE